jgi:hypothetical protein
MITSAGKYGYLGWGLRQAVQGCPGKLPGVWAAGKLSNGAQTKIAMIDRRTIVTVASTHIFELFVV